MSKNIIWEGTTQRKKTEQRKNNIRKEIILGGDYIKEKTKWE